VHISRGVTTHGFALNVTTDLEYFDLIVPCGLFGKPVTSMHRELQKSLTIDDVATSASRNFGRVFQSQMLWLESLDDLLAQVVPQEPISQSATTAKEQPANQDTPARPPRELRELHGDGSELA
jgi:lipoyl(octanoyl) transferase